MVAVAVVSAIISYQHAYGLVRSHGDFGMTARLLPFTVDGLIWVAHRSSRLRRPWSRPSARSTRQGHSQRAFARELNIDRRKVKRIIDRAA